MPVFMLSPDEINRFGAVVQKDVFIDMLARAAI
jgi:hypothetical protein